MARDMRKDEANDKAGKMEAPRRSNARSPIRASSAVTAMTRAIAGRAGLDTLTVATRWRDIVGPALASHTQIVSITKPKSKSGGTLTLKADGGSALLVQHHQREILGRVNAILGADAITQLKTVQGTLAAQRAIPPKPRPPRLSAAEEEAVRRSVAGVQDDELRKRLAGLMRHVVDGSNRR